MSLSAPVTVQMREYIDPANGVATPESIMTVMGGSGNEQCGNSIVDRNKLLLTLYSDHLRIHSHFNPNCHST